MKQMTSLERVLTTLSHKEPDRIPLFLLLTFYGAKELNMSIKEYFSSPKNVVEGQLKMREKYSNDCLSNFLYAPLEVEAWGSEVIFIENGPPNTGRPFIESFERIKELSCPNILNSKCLTKVLTITENLKKAAGNDIPIIGVVMSPFSLPVMQMGFDKYLEIIYNRPELFNRLMAINEEFCTNWANAQLDAGATAICYFDPVSSNTIIPRNLYIKTGFEVAKRTISKINGPTATHLASGRGLNIFEDIMKTGTAAVAVSCLENLNEIKNKCSGKLSIIGNLNGIEMCHWNKIETERKIKDAIKEAGKGGGFILSDNHGEIPWQVSQDTLLQISKAIKRWGNYPLDWIDDGK